MLTCTDAWHQLGTTHAADDALAALSLGGLSEWHVRKVPVTAIDQWKGRLAIPSRYATVRDSPTDPKGLDFLGLVGETYRVFQNEDHTPLLDALAAESGARFETAGELDGGRKFFVTLKLPGQLRIGGEHQVDMYLALVNSHDGSMALSLIPTPVLASSQTTLNTGTMLRIRHTATLDPAQAAADALETTFDYLDGFQRDAQRLAGAPLGLAEFEEMIAAAFGPPSGASAATITRTENKLDKMAELFADKASTTAWAGWTAIAEWADHHAPTRGDDRDTARATNAVLDPSFKAKALAVVKATAGIA